MICCKGAHLVRSRIQGDGGGGAEERSYEKRVHVR